MIGAAFLTLALIDEHLIDYLFPQVTFPIVNSSALPDPR